MEMSTMGNTLDHSGVSQLKTFGLDIYLLLAKGLTKVRYPRGMAAGML